jgi:hypothetical protein
MQRIIQDRLQSNAEKANWRPILRETWSVGAVLVEVQAHRMMGPISVLEDVSPTCLKELCCVQVTEEFLLVSSTFHQSVHKLECLVSSYYLGASVLLICFSSGDRLLLSFGDSEDRWRVNTRLRRFQHSLSMLPSPILCAALKHLSDSDLANAARACRLFYNASKEEMIARKPPFWCVWRPNGLLVCWDVEKDGIMTISATRNAATVGQDFGLDTSFFRVTANQPKCAGLLIDNVQFTTTSRIVICDENWLTTKETTNGLVSDGFLFF